MAKLSISSTLKRIQRRRVFTLLACLALIVAATQMTLFKGGKKSQARVPGVVIDDVNKTCTIVGQGSDAGPVGLPAGCKKDYAVVIDSSYIDMGAVAVWQHDGSHEECPVYAGYTLMHLDSSAHTCSYQLNRDNNIQTAPPYGMSLSAGGKMNSGSYPNATFAFIPSSWMSNGCAVNNVGLDGRWDVLGKFDGLCYYGIVYSNSNPNLQHYTVYTQPSKVFSHTEGSFCFIPSTAYLVDPETYGDCDTKRVFASLSLENHSVLKHTAVSVLDVSDAVNGSLVGVNTGAGRWKKVDIETTGNFSLSGQIVDRSGTVTTPASEVNVDGKGYPGGDIAKCWTAPPSPMLPHNLKGYGPGYGSGSSNSGTNDNWGGGASYGGVGVRGAGSGTVYGDKDISVFDFGSGGGGATVNGCAYRQAGAPGGGRIRIVATGTFTIGDHAKISANGGMASGINYNDSNAFGGAGSGGSIIIKYGSTTSNLVPAMKVYYANNPNNMDTVGTVQTVNVSSSLNGSAAPDERAEVLYNDPVKKWFVNISTDGGGPGLGGGVTDGVVGNNTNPGGGGRIYIEKIQAPTVTMTKWLEAVNRNDASPANTGFNPYALQIGDIIRVHIKMGAYSGPATLIDDFLNVLGTTKKCVYPVPGAATGTYTATPAPKTPLSTTSISWDLNSATYANGGTDGAKEANYYCKVQ